MNKNKEVKRVTVVLDKQLYDKLTNIADKETRSITSLVTHTLIKMINEYDESHNV